MDTYKEMLNRHREEVSAQKMFYAFSAEQFADGLERIDAEKSEVVRMPFGGFMRKDDVPGFLAMRKRQAEELESAMKDAAFAEEAFLYEMNDHEYAINWQGDYDVMLCFGIELEPYDSEEALCDALNEREWGAAYLAARRRHFKQMKEWDAI